MTFFIPLAIALQGDNLAQTAPWKDFKAVIQSAGSYQVTAFTTVFKESPAEGGRRGPRWSSLTVQGNQRVLETSDEVSYWNGKTATTYNLKFGGLTIIAKDPGIGIFALCGLGELAAERATISLLTSQTAGSLEYGVRCVFPWLDTSESFELWFDPKTKLPSRAFYGTNGMQPQTRYEMGLEWKLNPTLAKDFFVPKAPKKEPLIPSAAKYSSFKRVKGLPPGLGQVTIRLPAKVEGAVTIDGGNERRFRFRGSGEFSVPLPAFLYRVDIGPNVMAATVYDGYETLIEVGALRNDQSKTITFCDEQGNKLFVLKSNAVVPLLPGTYFAKVGNALKGIEIKKGLVASVPLKWKPKD